MAKRKLLAAQLTELAEISDELEALLRKMDAERPQPVAPRPKLRLIQGGLAACLLLAGPAAAHDGYADWKDSNGISCCSSKDCFPAEFSTDRSGKECIVMPDGACIPVPYDKVIKAEHHNGGAHICARKMAQGWQPLCYAPGSGA